MNDLYQDENVTKTEEYLSPSTKYKLIINTYNTSKITNKNTWEYTKGIIYNIDSLNIVGFIKRNYSAFPFLFFVKDGVEYLISGRSYMSQTILNCETGQIHDNTNDPDRSQFCWSEIIQVDENTVAVNGCFWGASYEYKFFDFTDISKGWDELEVSKNWTQFGREENYLDCYCENGHIVDKINNIITILHKEWSDNEYSDDEECTIDNSDIVVRLQRKNDKMIMLSVKLSENQIKKENERDMSYKIQIEKYTEMKNKSNFYLNLMPEIEKFKLSDSNLQIREVTCRVTGFEILINYKKIKTCVVRFSNIYNTVNFSFYNWKDNKYNIALELTKDVVDVMCKIKELLKD